MSLSKPTDSFCGPSSCAEAPIPRGAKRARVGEELGLQVHAGTVKDAINRVNAAMRADKSGWTAMHIDWLIANNKLKAKAGKVTDGVERPMPACCNKWHLLGAERIKDILLTLESDFDQEALSVMTLADLRDLLRYALALSDTCALPSRVFSEVKRAAEERYNSLGGRRLQHVLLTKEGDCGHVWYRINWGDHGCFKLVRKGKKVVGVQHVSGKTVALKPPLDESYTLVKNNKDKEATLTSSKKGCGDFPVEKLFREAGALGALPAQWDDARIGQASPPKEQQAAKPLAIMDAQEVVDAAAGESDGEPPPSPGVAVESPAAATPPPKGPPRGRGTGPRPVGPPPRKKGGAK